MNKTELIAYLNENGSTSCIIDTLVDAFSNGWKDFTIADLKVVFRDEYSAFLEHQQQAFEDYKAIEETNSSINRWIAGGARWENKNA